MGAAFDSSKMILLLDSAPGDLFLRELDCGNDGKSGFWKSRSSLFVKLKGLNSLKSSVSLSNPARLKVSDGAWISEKA